MAQQWEYKKLPNPNQATLDELGKQGWELTAISNSSRCYNDPDVYVLKRPIEIEKTHDSYGHDGR